MNNKVIHDSNAHEKVRTQKFVCTGFSKEEGENWDKDNWMSDGLKNKLTKNRMETHFNTSIMLFLTPTSKALMEKKNLAENNVSLHLTMGILLREIPFSHSFFS